MRNNSRILILLVFTIALFCFNIVDVNAEGIKCRYYDPDKSEYNNRIIVDVYYYKNSDDDYSINAEVQGRQNATITSVNFNSAHYDAAFTFDDNDKERKKEIEEGFINNGTYKCPEKFCSKKQVKGEIFLSKNPFSTAQKWGNNRNLCMMVQLSCPLSTDMKSCESNEDNQTFEDDTSAYLDTEKDRDDINGIIEWGITDANSLYSADGQLNPCTIIDGDLKNLINSVLGFISIAGIILLITMSMIEFIKALTGANDDLLKTAFKHTIIRIVCAIILFLLPMIISGIINIINNANGPATDANGNVIMGEDGNPLCGVGE